MDRSLGILEIVEMICGHVRDGTRGTNRTTSHSTWWTDLAALARTCKIFHHPAVDMLWRVQYDLKNLIRCMPSDAWREDLEAGVLRFLRPITREDWERPLLYAARVRFLTISHCAGSSLQFLETINFPLPQDCLFPNLRCLSWSTLKRELYSHVPVLLGPQITKISLSLGDSVEQCKFLSYLPERCPELQHVSLVGYYSHIGLAGRSVSPCVRRFTKIKALAVDTIDQPAFEHLAQLETLEYLRLQEAKGDISHWQYSKQPPFPTLRRLTFLSTTVEFATEFVMGLSGCQLTDFNVGIQGMPSSTATGELYAALASHCSHSSLSSLSISSAVIDGPPIPDVDDTSNYVVRVEHLRPLFHFSNLTVVYLEPPVGFAIDDAAAWDIARAWPNIQNLVLLACTDLHHPPHMTLCALSAFAEHCPQLTSLQIAFDASVVLPLDPSVPVRPSLQTALTNLGVGYSPISSAGAVALFISGIFTSVSAISTAIDNEGRTADEDQETEEYAHHELWQRVQSILPLVNEARADERRRAQLDGV
ncbi:hypothetical protein C8R44DRAFT_869554 [Mycena epipterygia]|nr:hypothetical protein C8R44DRAFT_869554 [Mycena epipterygia]